MGKFKKFGVWLGYRLALAVPSTFLFVITLGETDFRIYGRRLSEFPKLVTAKFNWESIFTVECIIFGLILAFFLPPAIRLITRTIKRA